jgi:4-hydroxybenzoate polyprenyltransferase
MAFRKAFELLVMSDIYASAIAAGIAIITDAVLRIPLEVLPIAAVFFTALAVYSLNRQDDNDIDAVNIPERTKFVERRGWIVLAFSTAGFFSILTYTLLFNLQVSLIMAVVYVLGLFYSFPLLRPLEGVLGFSRMKEPLVVKNTFASSMYGAFVLIPVYFAHAQISVLVALLCVFVFLRFFIVSTIFDMRDIEGDSKKNIRTIPVTYGKEKTLAILHGLNAFTLIMGAAAAIYHDVPPLFGAMILATFLYSLFYIEECRRENADMRHLCGVIVEADFLPALAIAIPFILIPLL